jgi:hypothetical protein
MTGSKIHAIPPSRTGVVATLDTYRTPVHAVLRCAMGPEGILHWKHCYSVGKESCWLFRTASLFVQAFAHVARSFPARSSASQFPSLHFTLHFPSMLLAVFWQD